MAETADHDDPLPSARDLFAGSNEAILVHDPDDGAVLDANPMAERLYGYEKAALRGTQIESLLAGDREQDHDVTKLTAEEGSVRWLVEHPDEERRWIDASFEQTPGEEYILSFGRDVTDEQIQREALDQREQALETSIDGMAIVDTDRNFAYANRAYADIHGVADPDSLVGRHWRTLQADGEWEHLSERAIPTAEDQGEWRGETVGETADGERVEKELSLRLLDDGEMVVVVRDVTDLRARERELRENQHTLRRLQEIVSDREAAFETKIQRLLELGCDWLDLPYGFVTHIDEGVQTIESAVGDHEKIQPGESVGISDTYCQYTLDAADDDDHVYSVTDVPGSEIDGTDAYDTFGLSCYIGGAVEVNEESYGTICFADDTPRQEPFSGMEQTFVDLVTEWVGLEIERMESEATLRGASALREEILAASPTGIVVFDEEGRVSMANERASALLAVDTLVGKTALASDLRDEDGAPLDPAELPNRRVLAERREITGQYTLTVEGRQRYLRVAGRPLSTDRQEGAVLTIEDVTEQRRQEDAMQALTDTMAVATGSFEEQLSALLDVGRTHLGLGNGHLTEIDGGTHEIVATNGLSDVLRAHRTTDLSETYCRHVLESDDTWSVGDAAAAMADDPAHQRWGLAAYIGTEISVDGETTGTLCFADDRPRSSFSAWEQAFVETLARWIEARLERRQREAAYDRSRSLLEAVFNAPERLVGITDEAGNLTDANDAALAFIGADPDEHIGEPVWETPWWDNEASVEACRDAVAAALEGERTTFESTYGAGDDEPAVFEVTVRPVEDDGEVINVIVEGHDVTESRRRERELRRRQQYIDTVLENAPLVLFALDEDGTFQFSRGQGLRTLGLADQELRGESLYDRFGDAEGIVEDFERALAGETVESVRDLGPAVYRTWYRSVDLDGERTVIGLGADITQQRRQEERIREVSDATESLLYARSPEEVAETVVDIAAEVLSYPLAGVWFHEDDDEALDPVAATEEVLSYMAAPTADEALPTITPGTHEYDVFASGETDIVADYGAVDGVLGAEDGPGTVIMVPLGEYGMLHVGATDREPPDDVQLDLIRILSRNAQAALTATTREAELAASKTELERSNEALQQFAYIASHDLQEPLRMVSSYIDLLNSEYGDQLDEEASEYMHYAVDGATRMKEMIDGLLAYSRVKTKGSDPEPVDPGAVLETTLRELSLYLDGTDMSVEYGELPMVRADPTQLSQVFQNLIKNAAEHGDAARVEIDGTVSGDRVTLTVTDDGTGISEADRDRVFDIFEQSHDAEGGSGIGLAVCERIVARHGGEISVGAGPDGGAQFTIELPRGEADAR